jgi:Tellurite resistance protein TerB
MTSRARHGNLSRMANPGVLSPLFTNLPISADDAVAMAAGLSDIAAIDGTHADEQALILSLVGELAADLGDTLTLPPMSPREIGHKLVQPELRTVFLQAALLLAMADGAISAAERQRIREYARALEVSDAAYAELERVIESWVRSGELQQLFS